MVKLVGIKLAVDIVRADPLLQQKGGQPEGVRAGGVVANRPESVTMPVYSDLAAVEVTFSFPSIASAVIRPQQLS